MYNLSLHGLSNDYLKHLVRSTVYTGMDTVEDILHTPTNRSHKFPDMTYSYITIILQPNLHNLSMLYFPVFDLIFIFTLTCVKLRKGFEQ